MHGGFDRQTCLPVAKTIANLIFADMLYYYMEIVPDLLEEESNGKSTGNEPEGHHGNELEAEESANGGSKKEA